MFKKIVGLFLFAGLSACGSSSSEPEPTPYVALPIASLESGTSLEVRGNHTGWWQVNRSPTFDAINQDGPKLQRLNITDTPDVFEAVFRNNIPGSEKNYGKVLFTMPGEGGVVSGETDLGYHFTITRVNANLIYTLTGRFTISNGINPPGEFRLAHGGYVAGSHVAEGDLPTSGVFEYEGVFAGSSNIRGNVLGDVTLTADLNGVDVVDLTGSISNIENASNETISDITIEASIDNVTGDFEGRVFIATGSGAPGDFADGSDGIVEGGFYGPNAEEIGGTIRVNDSGHFLTGAFGGALAE